MCAYSAATRASRRQRRLTRCSSTLAFFNPSPCGAGPNHAEEDELVVIAASAYGEVVSGVEPTFLALPHEESRTLVNTV